MTELELKNRLKGFAVRIIKMVDSKTTWSEKFDFNTIISKVKWLFKKDGNNWWDSSKSYRKIFSVTRKDSIISVTVAIIVVAGAVFYGMEVYSKYTEINNNYDSLKQLSTYNLTIDPTLTSSYSNW